MSEERRPKRRIAAYFGLLVLSASLAATFAVSGAMILLEYRHGLDQIEEHLAIVGDSHAPAIANALKFGDQDGIQTLLEGIVALPHVRSVEMRSASGSVAAAGAPIAGQADIRMFPLKIFRDGQDVALGEMTVAVDHDEIHASIQETALIVVPVNAAWTLLLAALIFRLAERRIARPLEALARHARDFKQDDLFVPLRLPERGDGPPDEIDQLETALNAMRLRLRAAHMESQFRADELETAVHERTRKLHDAEVFAQRAVEYLADALIVIGLDGGIRRVNPAAERMFGYAAAEMIGANVNVLMPEPHKSAHDGYLSRYRRTGQTNIIGQGRELTARRKDGTLFPVDLTVAEIMGSRERLFIGTLRDLTERRQAEQQLVVASQKAEVANRAKSDFLAIMSHELRTPLNAVLGYTDLMRTQAFGPIDNPRYAEYLDIIHASGGHLLELIGDILDVSAIEAGTVVLREEALDAQQLCRDALRLVAPRADKGKVRLENRCPGGLPRFAADERRMKQILLNLLANAVKFTDAGGSAAVAARLGADRAMTFIVSDTGIGMSETEAAHALHPFGQADTRLSRKYEGSGLGLPLTKGLVELHGGTLTIDSAPGRGTVVTVRLPPERTQAAIAPEARPI